MEWTIDQQIQMVEKKISKMQWRRHKGYVTPEVAAEEVVGLRCVLTTLQKAKYERENPCH